MKLMKFTLALLTFCAVIGLYAADLMLEVRTSKEDVAAQSLAAADATIAQASADDKHNYIGAKALYMTKYTKGVTFAQVIELMKTEAARLGVDGTFFGSYRCISSVHPWWVGRTDNTLIDACVTYYEANPPHGEIVTGAYNELASLYKIKKDYVKALAAYEKVGNVKDTMKLYIQMQEINKAVELYYQLAEAEKLDAQTAADVFPDIWAAQVKGFKTAEERAAAKFQLSKLVDQYTNKMYNDSKVKPEQSPWRQVITLWTANSK